MPGSLFILRFAIAVILLVHSIPSIVSGDVNNFGKFYLNENGFAPVGVILAWAIKLSHIAAAVCIILQRYIKIAGWVTIGILAAGIIMVHAPEGWYVVGGGRNGAEFNFLLIATLLTIMYPGKIKVFDRT